MFCGGNEHTTKLTEMARRSRKECPRLFGEVLQFLHEARKLLQGGPLPDCLAGVIRGSSQDLPAGLDSLQNRGVAADLDSAAVIVVVDDTPTVLKSVSSMLKRSGYEVHSAASADAAVEIFRSLNYEVDLLLTDVVMPEMDGWELAAVIEESAPHIPVLFMSGFVQDEEMIARFLECPELILEKPFSSENLMNRVSSLITAARSERD